MNFLVDTHILIWYAENDKKLSSKVLQTLESQRSHLFVSHATYWEMTIKCGLGKLLLKNSITDFYQAAVANSFDTLHLDVKHLHSLESLPLLHSDPFDRMIIAQAMSENLTIVTQDRRFELYEGLVSILWN